MFDRTLNIPSTSSHFLLHILQLAISIRRADRPCFVGPWHSSSLCIRLSNRTGVTIGTVKKSKHIESRLIQIGYWPQSLQCRELLFSIARSCENESWQPVGILVRLGKEKNQEVNGTMVLLFIGSPCFWDESVCFGTSKDDKIHFSITIKK